MAIREANENDVEGLACVQGQRGKSTVSAITNVALGGVFRTF
jgi:hypothetical protein